MEETKTRLNKFLSNAGVCSRREADRQIEAGNVMIDDHIAQMGESILPGAQVRFQGRLIEQEKPEEVILLVNKPRGIVCTAEKREKDNIVDYLHYETRIYPVGRLDKDSRGLILMTNNGDIVNKMMRAGNYHEKEYIVKVNKPLTRDVVRDMARGVPLRELKTITRECKVTQLDKVTMSITLTQGLNRQIRRMCEFFGYRVVDLKRVRIMNLKVDDIPEGQYRRITEEELTELKKMIGKSSNNFHRK